MKANNSPVRRWCVMVALLATSACEKVVNITVPEGAKQLVVEGRLERVRGAVTGQQRIRLTTTDAYFSNTALPPARGASVRVVEEGGRVVSFGEVVNEPGVYATADLIAVVNRRYTLQIIYQNERYEATEVLRAVPPIDSLYFKDRIGQLGPQEGLRATIDFRDLAGTQNFYLWDQFVNGQRLTAADSTFRTRVVAPDDGLDGRPISQFQPYDGIPVSKGASVLVRQMSLSEPVYRFYRALSDQSSNDGSPFAVPLASVRGNVSNLTNAAHRPLGYFMATEVAEARAVAP